MKVIYSSSSDGNSSKTLQINVTQESVHFKTSQYWGVEQKA